MTVRNNRIRFCQNNMLQASGVTLTFTGAKTGFPGANLTSPYRYLKWIPPGTFTITTANQKIYINDGGAKTATITTGTYTYLTLPAAIVTALNAVSSSWTCTYDFAGGTFKFTIGRSAGTCTLVCTTTTNAAWDDLGYSTALDRTGAASYTANYQRNHTYESVTIDMGVARAPLAFMVIGDADAIFPLSSSATLTLKANNVNSFGSPTISRSLTAETGGIFHWLDDLADTTNRYWEFKIVDRTNPLGPEGLGLNIAYLGDYVTPLATNLVNGFSWQVVDPSLVSLSVAGVPYFRRQTKYHRFENMRIENVSQADRLTLMTAYSQLGVTTPFFLALDPTQAISATAGEMTKYAIFDQPPTATHILYQLFNHGFSAREVI